jgi:hypothetical protein
MWARPIITASVGVPVTQLAQAHRAGEGERVAGARLLLGRSDDPDIVGKGARDRLQHLEAGRVDAVVVGEEDPHRPGYAARPGERQGRREAETIDAAAAFSKAKQQGECDAGPP